MSFEGRRRCLRVVGAAGIALCSLAPRNARPQATRTLGVLHWENRQGFDRERPGIFAALAEKGWQEGRTLRLTWRESRADARDVDVAARELVAGAPHAILTESTPLTRALAGATSTIPIVTSVGDPLATGFAASLARPGRNVTGLSNLGDGYELKCLELLRGVAPQASTVLLFYSPTWRTFGERFLAQAGKARVEMRLVAPDSAKDALNALGQAPRGSCAAVVGGVIEEDFLETLANELPRRGVPALSVKGGIDERFLLSYEQYHANAPQRLAAVLDKVLRGANPAGIPFEQPEAEHVVVNRRIARSMGVEIPAVLRLRATRMID